MIVLILITVFVLPFANGANDNSTGVATVIGVGLAIAIGGLLTLPLASAIGFASWRSFS